MTIFLDGALIAERKSIHDYLAEQLALPGYYGRNLDALYDVLTERNEPLTIIWKNKSFLSGYGLRVMHTLQDAANNNPAITLEEKDC